MSLRTLQDRKIFDFQYLQPLLANFFGNLIPASWPVEVITYETGEQLFIWYNKEFDMLPSELAIFAQEHGLRMTESDGPADDGNKLVLLYTVESVN